MTPRCTQENRRDVARTQIAVGVAWNVSTKAKHQTRQRNNYCIVFWGNLYSYATATRLQLRVHFDRDCDCHCDCVATATFSFLRSLPNCEIGLMNAKQNLLARLKWAWAQQRQLLLFPAATSTATTATAATISLIYAATRCTLDLH